MNLLIILKPITLFISFLLVVLAIAVFTLLNVEHLQRAAIATTVNMTTGLNADVGNVTGLEIFPDLRFTAKDIRIHTTAGPEWLVADSISIKFVPWSTFRSQPSLVSDARVDTIKLDLRHLKTVEKTDGPLDLSWINTGIQFVSRIDHWEVSDGQVIYWDDDQDIVLNVAAISGGTRSGQSNIKLRGDLNDLPVNLESSGNLEKSHLKGSLTWGRLTATFSSNPTPSATTPVQEHDLLVSAPSSRPILDLLGITEMRDGKFTLHVNALQSATHADTVIDVDMGEFQLDISTRIDDMTTFNAFEFSYQASGPSLEEAGAVFNLLDFPSQQFSLQGQVTRKDSTLNIDRSELIIGDGTFIVQGSLPNYPTIDGWQFELEGDEIGLDMVKPFTGRCNLPTDAFRWVASFGTDTNGVETVHFLMESPQKRLQIEGSIGPAPDYTGTHVVLSSDGVVLGDLGHCVGIENLAELPVQISATVTKSAKMWELAPATFRTDAMLVDLTLVANQLPGPDPVDLTIDFSTDDLAKIFKPSALTRLEAVASRPLTATAKITGSTSALILESTFRFDAQPGAIQGQLGDITTLQPLNLQFEFSGDDIWKRHRNEANNKVPFELSGNVISNPDGWAFSKVELVAKGVDLALNGTLSNQEYFIGSLLELDLQSDQLSVLLPSEWSKESLTKSVNINLSTRYEEKGFEIDRLQAVIGNTTLNASGFIDLPPDLRGTQGQLTIEGSSTSELLTLFGHDSGFLDRSFNVTAKLNGGLNETVIEQLNLTVGNSDLAGGLSIEWKDTPYLDLDLRSQYLYMPFFFPSFENIETEPGELQIGDMSQYEDELTEQELSERLIEDTTLPTSWMMLFDGELLLNAENVFFTPGTSPQVNVDLALSKGTIRTRELSWNGPSLAGQAEIEMKHTEQGGDYFLDIDSTRLPVFSLFSGDSNADDDASYRARLLSSGDSVSDLLGNMNGQLLYRGSGGKLHANQLDTFFGDFFSQLTARVLGQTESTVNVQCTAAAMDIVDGELTLDPALVLRTDRVDILASGKVDLAEESLGLMLNTRSRKGIGISALKTVSPRSRIAGTFANPLYVFDATGAVASGTAAMATGGLTVVASGLRDRLLARRANPCDVIYEQALNHKDKKYDHLVTPQ